MIFKQHNPLRFLLYKVSAAIPYLPLIFALMDFALILFHYC